MRLKSLRYVKFEDACKRMKGDAWIHEALTI